MGPWTGEDGRQRITMRTPAPYAETLRDIGFTPEARRTRLVPRDESGEVGRAVAALGCATPPLGECPEPQDFSSEYVKPLFDIESELTSIAATSPDITLQDIGDSESGVHDIYAIQFGPLEPIENPPTVYLVSTYHAREWIVAGTAMYLANYLRRTLTIPTFDPALRTSLELAAVVIVPVANPDGYERTWTPGGGQRFWRNNLNFACGGGVNLNRNHSETFFELGQFTKPTCAPPTTENWRGPGPSSEAETQALDRLYLGEAFLASTGPQVPAAVVSYHSYANMVIYAEGYEDGSFGPPCSLNGTSNCTNPDFQVLRDLFGDTHRAWGPEPFFFDDGSPYLRDQGGRVLYSVAGDTNLHNSYHSDPDARVITVTPELPGECFGGGVGGFQIECHPEPDDKIQEVGESQVELLRHLSASAPALVSNDEAVAYGPTRVGTYPSGLWAREYHPSGPTNDSARATFVKSVFRPEGTGHMVSTINGNTFDFLPGRIASQYELHYLTHEDEAFEDEAFDPLCLPCRIESGAEDEGESADGTLCAEEETCVDLCDPGERWSLDGWDIVDGDRGGSRDCFLQPTDVGGELLIHGGSGLASYYSPDVASHCTLSFSAEWDLMSPSETVVLERESTSGGWEEVWRMPYAPPVNNSFQPHGRVLSFAFEANSGLPDAWPTFRFRLAGAAVPGNFKLFEPVVYCRLGGLPR